FAPKVAERPKARPDTVLSVDQAVAKVLEAAPKGLPTDGALARVPLPQPRPVQLARSGKRA
ncbi:MAG: hypothetical protein AAGB15_14490, partial [Pseudomonadota bacterium]